MVLPEEQEPEHALPSVFGGSSQVPDAAVGGGEGDGGGGEGGGGQ